MRYTSTIVAFIVLTGLSGCNPLPTADAEIRAFIESKYDTTIGVAARKDQLFLISFYDTELFNLAPSDQRRVADAVAADIVDALPNSLVGLSVVFGEDIPRRGIAFNYVYEIRADVPVLNELLKPPPESQ